MENLIKHMREVLGTAFVIYMTSHAYHWSVEGPMFYEYHKLLELQYNEVWESIDDIAEHIRTLDAYTPQSLTRMVELSRVEEALPAPTGSHDMFIGLVIAHEIMCDLLLETIKIAQNENQEGLVNFLGGRIEAHQKHRWMLRSTAKPNK